MATKTIQSLRERLREQKHIEVTLGRKLRETRKLLAENLAIRSDERAKVLTEMLNNKRAAFWIESLRADRFEQALRRLLDDKAELSEWGRTVVLTALSDGKRK